MKTLQIMQYHFAAPVPPDQYFNILMPAGAEIMELITDPTGMSGSHCLVVAADMSAQIEPRKFTAVHAMASALQWDDDGHVPLKRRYIGSIQNHGYQMYIFEGELP